MSKIILSYRKDEYKGNELPTYSLSFYHALLDKEYEVTRIGSGWEYEYVEDVPKYKDYSLFIDLDCGRDHSGQLHFRYQNKKCPIPSVLRTIDEHGKPTVRKRIAQYYDHIAFAVWDRRDLFTKHPSAFWCPCASDDRWFDYKDHMKIWRNPKYTAGFFGSRHGLHRADMLKKVCHRREWKCDIREVGRQNKPRWPRTAEAMVNCKLLYNKSQKHDVNQRIFESMLMRRPLLTDRDSRSGLDKLFTEYEHYFGYDTSTTLGNQMEYLLNKDNEGIVSNLVKRAYKEVKEKHLVKHRVEQILEVVGL